MQTKSVKLTAMSLLTFLCATTSVVATAQSAANAQPAQKSSALNAMLTAGEQRLEQEATPREGSPNIIYILLDDTGFADFGSFGSEINTPAMDSLAREGLRYNNFHTRAICSPTRAALLTGRNSHSVGVGLVVNMLSGYPNGQGRIDPSAGTVAEVLQSNGYRTFAVGKWHLAPSTVTDNRKHWPLGRGFEQYYGFLDGMTDQFFPDLVIDNSSFDFTPRPDYHLSEDLVDKAISYIAAEKAVTPDRPFFLYLAFGATHAPHQVPKSYIDKYATTYTQGWDKIRAARFARQKELGIIPRNAQMAPRNPDVKAWSELSADERQVNARFQAAYAGFLEHTDEQIGRLIDFLKKSNQYDNSIIILTADNGGSIEGHETGTLNEVSSLNRIPETAAEMVKRVDEIGLATTYPNYPSGWAQVSNTPFKFYKTTIWDGGTRTPLIIRYPGAIKDAGQIRSQFVDVIDITPTVLDLVGIKVPDTLNGIQQMPVAGKSFRATFDDAKAPAARNTQYFELLGQRAILHNGWHAISEHTPGMDFADNVWHLYDRNKDFSGLEDIAGKYPEKLQELQDLWLSEAKAYGVLPLMNASMLGSFSPEGKDMPKYKTARDARPEYIMYPEQAVINRTYAPKISRGSYSITVELGTVSGNESGVLVADGDRFGGYSLYVLNGYPVFEENDLGAVSKLRATRPLDKTVKEIRYEFSRTDAAGGTGTLFYNGKPVGSAAMQKRATNLSSVAGFSIGRDAAGAVSDDYPTNDQFPIAEGVIDRVIVRTDQ